MSLKTLPSVARLAGLLVIAITLSLQAQGQDGASSTEPYIIKVEGLNPADYALIVKGLRAADETVVNEACIPAGLLALDAPSGWSLDQSFQQVRNVVQAKTSLETVTLLNGVSFEQFRQSCLDARLGRTGQ